VLLGRPGDDSVVRPPWPGWEAAYAALFLISNESSYATARTLFFDGGHPGGMVRG